MKRKVLILLGIAVLVATFFQNCSGVSFDSQNTSAKNSTTGGTTPSTGTNFPTPAPTPSPTIDGNGCPTVLPAATKTCRIYLPPGSSTRVPCDWNSAMNTIEAIGSGADGGGDVRAGGGGGAYSESVNVVLVRGSTVAYNISHFTMGYPLTGHDTHIDAGDSYLCNSTSGCSSMADSAVVVGAQGGFGSVNNSSVFSGQDIDTIAGPGGQASAGVAIGPGAAKYSGGAGGNCQNNSCSATSTPGSGGGAAGPHGDGVGGGSVAGSGGAGDAGYGGAGGGLSAVGGNGTEWDVSHGSGGGGGGADVGVGGGDGGNYGGGGGGGGTDHNWWGQLISTAADKSGNGGMGLIVLTYAGSTCN